MNLPHKSLKILQHLRNLPLYLSTISQKNIFFFNKYIKPEIPIANEQVLFADDLIRSHRAVNKIVPGVHCTFPAPNLNGGMLTLLEVLDEIEEG
jgi:hypothetical protein